MNGMDVLMQFGERKGLCWKSTKGTNNVEESMVMSGYLTSRLDAGLVRYEFTEKAWQTYRQVKELTDLT